MTSMSYIYWASLSKPHHYATALMEFLYVCTVVIPYYVLIQNYMKPFCKCKLFPHIITPPMPCSPTLPVSSSFNMDSGGEDTAEEKRHSNLDDEENTESIEIEKQLKKKIAGDFYVQANRCCLSSACARSAEA